MFKIRIRSAQNVGKVWISRNKHILTLLHAIAKKSHGPKNEKRRFMSHMFCYVTGLGIVAAIHIWKQ